MVSEDQSFRDFPGDGQRAIAGMLAVMGRGENGLERAWWELRATK